ncbi:MAG TPA: glycosyltransferase [Bacteroidetes bacterium]|nr:N-glycosyltransferase [bacterium BMS3Bbin04]HDO64621.1 glycosyltransferase [Bacteroidota bacterium]HEX03746.1 glycosyltransferase [Bacteroidota bacterium]
MMFLPLIPAALMVLLLLMAKLMIRVPWPSSPRKEPVTVVVCARDEEPAILECLISLSEQTYPEDLYQILLVDHLSKDRTGEIMDHFAEESSVKTRVIHVTSEDGGLKGKVQALDIALDQVDTEYVLLTDGDCVVSDTWVEKMVSYLEDDVAIINGHVRVEDTEQEGSLLARLQDTINLMFLAFSSGNSSFQKPPSLYHPILRPFSPLLRRIRPSFNMGNNQGIRMSVYREIGGLRKVGPTLIEDVALVNRILQTTDYKTAVVMDPETIVTTRPSRNVRDFWRQSRRWASATDRVQNRTNTVLLSLFVVNRIFLPWTVILFPITGLIAILSTGYAEYLLIREANRILQTHTPKRDVIMHLVTQILLNHLVGLALLFRTPVIWKGQVYES